MEEDRASRYTIWRHMKAKNFLYLVLGTLSALAGLVASGYMWMDLENVGWSLQRRFAPGGSSVWNHLLDLAITSALCVGAFYMSFRMFRRSAETHPKINR